MKQINVYFDDDEMVLLNEKRGKMTWHNFIMSFVKGGKKNE